MSWPVCSCPVWKSSSLSLREDRIRINYVSAEDLGSAIGHEFQRLLDELGAGRTAFEICPVARIDADPHTGKRSLVNRHAAPSGGGAAEIPISIDSRAADPAPSLAPVPAYPEKPPEGWRPTPDQEDLWLYARQDEAGDTYLAAYVVVDGPTPPPDGALRQALAARLTGPMVPRGSCCSTRCR